MLLESIGAIFGTIVVATASYGVGVLILPYLPDSIARFHRYVYAWIGGFGLLGVLLFVIGQWRFTRTIVMVVLAAAVLSAVAHIIRRRDLLLSFSPAIPRSAYLPAAIVAIVLAITAVAGLTKPVGDWNIDGVTYHFTGSKIWLRDGVIRPVPDNAPMSYPSVVEVVYAATAVVGGQVAGNFSAVFTLSLFFALAAILGVRCGLDKTAAWWVAALIAVMPAVYEGGHSGFVDVIYAAFALAAVRVGLDARRPREFAAFGIFCGLMMAAKYPGLVALPLLLVCVAWPQAGAARADYRSAFRNAAIAGVTACLVGGAFYLRNWILLGTPIYPPPVSAVGIFHPKYFSVAAIHKFYAFSIGRSSGDGRGLPALLLLPFNITYHTADFNGAGGIGLAPLAFGFIGVIAAWRDLFSRRLAVIAPLLTLAWFATMQEARYFIHVIAISAVFAVIGWRSVLTVSPRRITTALCAAVFACSVIYGLFMIGKSRASDMHAALSPSYALQRREREIPFVQSMDFVNADPSVTRLLILDRSVVAYYLDKDYLKPFGQWWEQVLPTAPDSAAVLEQLPSLGVSDILDVKSVAADFQVPPNYPGLTLIFETSDQRIYRVDSTASVADAHAPSRTQ
jgi:hypothetical protein